MEIRQMPIEKLLPARYNPRKDLKESDLEYQKLHKSTLEFGYVDPVIWNERTGNVVGGHRRLKLLRAESYTSIPVSVVDMDEGRERPSSLH